MSVILIPVIEIEYYSDKIASPTVSGYYDYPNEWSEYNRLSLIEAGYTDSLVTYLKGSSFYKLEDISEINLLHHLRRELEECEDIEELCKFSGGYVLNIDGVDILFPQCCSALADIESWQLLITGDTNGFWQGHPIPQITIEGGFIRFDVSCSNGERFIPPPPQEVFEFKVSDLASAVKLAEKELLIFAKRLEQINDDYDLNIPNIANVFINGDV